MTLMANILSVSPKALQEIEDLMKENIDEATDYILGGGESSLQPRTWTKFQARALTQLPHILREHIQDEAPPVNTTETLTLGQLDWV